MMNKDEVERRAVILENELKKIRGKSADVGAFVGYGPLVSAITRAKAGEITKPEDLPGMRYWMFENQYSSIRSA